MSARRDLPTGADNYIEAVTTRCCVDKTQFIGNLLPADFRDRGRKDIIKAGLASLGKNAAMAIKKRRGGPLFS